MPSTLWTRGRVPIPPASRPDVLAPVFVRGGWAVACCPGSTRVVVCRREAGRWVAVYEFGLLRLAKEACKELARSSQEV